MKTPKPTVLAVVALSLLAGCTKGGRRQVSPTPTSSTPSVSMSAMPGQLALVTDIGQPGSPDLDKRARLSEITEFIPSPNGRLLVVSHKDDRIFSQITPDGQVVGFLLKQGVTLPDGTVFGGALTAYIESDDSALVVNDTGLLVRVTSSGQALKLGIVPGFTTSSAPHILRSTDGTLFLVQGDRIFRLNIKKEHASFLEVNKYKVPRGFEVVALAADGESFLAENGKDRVVRLAPSGQTVSAYKIQATGGITSLAAGEAGDAWVGVSDGSIFHLQSNGRATKIVWGGTTCTRSFSSNPKSGTVSDADVLLAQKDRVYISDPTCRRIIVLGTAD